MHGDAANPQLSGIAQKHTPDMATAATQARKALLVSALGGCPCRAHRRNVIAHAKSGHPRALSTPCPRVAQLATSRSDALEEPNRNAVGEIRKLWWAHKDSNLGPAD